MKARIYPAITLFVALIALLLAVNFINQHRVPASLLPDVGANNFEQMVLQSKTPVFVEFYKHSCADCNAEFPVLDKLVAAYQGRLTFVRIDMDHEARLVAALNIGTAPTHVVFDPTTGSGFAKTGFLYERGLRSFIDHALQPPAPPAAPPGATPTSQTPAAPSVTSPQTPAAPAAPPAASPDNQAPNRTPAAPPAAPVSTHQ